MKIPSHSPNNFAHKRTNPTQKIQQNSHGNSTNFSSSPNNDSSNVFKAVNNNSTNNPDGVCGIKDTQHIRKPVY